MSASEIGAHEEAPECRSRLRRKQEDRAASNPTPSTGNDPTGVAGGDALPEAHGAGSNRRGHPPDNLEPYTVRR